jgi:hypothetical protein
MVVFNIVFKDNNPSGDNNFNVYAGFWKREGKEHLVFFTSDVGWSNSINID